MDEIKEIELSEFVQRYLEPIAGDSPTGSDAVNTEEYFKLNMEIPKVAPDYKLCKELSETILLEKSKDLRIATWLCFALFRSDKIKGLKEGLNIIYNLMVKYQNKLFPSAEAHRGKALQFLNTPRVFKLVEKEEINSMNAADVIESGKLLTLITEESGKLFPGNSPSLKQLQEVLDTHVQKANQFVSGTAKNGQGKDVKEETADKAKQEKVVVTPSGKIEDSQKTQSAEVPGATANGIQKEINTGAAALSSAAIPKELRTGSEASIIPLKDFKTGSEKEAVSQLKQILAFFYEEIQDGVKKEKVPASAFVFGISRQLQWEKLSRPVETDKVTQVTAPNQIIQGKIREWFSTGNWDALIPRVEINCLKSDSEFVYWLDAHRYVTKALEQKGGIYFQAAEDIKYHLSRLIKRIPDLMQMKFRDKQTPFADQETIKWINDEVKTAALGGQKNEIAALPPIIGEEYNEVNKMYETACSELPEKFEENLVQMQQAIDADTRIKGRFLRRLNLANYCIQSKQISLAKVYLTELKKEIDQLNLTEWEPALCTAVWESMFIANTKLSEEISDEDTKMMLEKEQKELFSRIAKYNGLLAIKILQNNK